MKRIVLVLAVQLLMANDANAATDEYEGCLAYNRSVTLSGTVLIRKIDYRKMMTHRPKVAFHFPCLSLTNPFACVLPMTLTLRKIWNGPCTLLIPARASGQLYRA
jgi:hypothetical protein